MTAYAAEAKRVTKRYGNFTALDKVDITVAKGAIYGLVGDNGAGKTTFLKLLSGHIYVDEGELKLFGCHRLKDMEEQRKRTGVVIEAPGFYPQISVEKNLEYYRILKGVPGKRVVDEILELVGLADKRKKRCRDLSLGMKQRLGLAIALIGEPELLILDEPINGLDPSGIIEIRNLMQRLNREKNITIILSSHILSELEQLATVYGFLTDGKLAEQVTAEEIKEKCSDYIEISVSDPERYTAVLEKKFHTERYKVLPDKTIHIMDPMMDIGAYSRLAGEYHMDISKLERRQVTLEEYYMDLKNGGQRHA